MDSHQEDSGDLVPLHIQVEIAQRHIERLRKDSNTMREMLKESGPWLDAYSKILWGSPGCETLAEEVDSFIERRKEHNEK